LDRRYENQAGDAGGEGSSEARLGRAAKELDDTRFGSLAGLDAAHDLRRQKGRRLGIGQAPQQADGGAQLAQLVGARRAARHVRVDELSLLEREISFQIVSQTVAYMNVFHDDDLPRCALT
jgi:hypothetical protein